MTTNQPSVEERLSRLETLFVNVGEKVVEHDGNIDVLVANIQQLTENVAAFVNVGEKVVEHDGNIDVLVAKIQQLTENVAVVSQRVDELNAQTTRNINRLAEEAAQDRQQAALDRQEFRNSINQILNYLRDRNGGSPPPQ